MKIQLLLGSLLCMMVFLMASASPAIAQAKEKDSKDVFVGAVEKIDTEARLVYVRSKDGVVKAFKWTRKTTAHGIKDAAVWTDHAAHVGAHVVIRSVKTAGEETIAGIHWFGAGTVKVVTGTVKFVGKGTKKVAVAVAGEAEEIYEVSEHAVVHTGKDIWHGAERVEKKVEKEVKSGIHIFEKGGKKFVKFIDHRLRD